MASPLSKEFWTLHGPQGGWTAAQLRARQLLAGAAEGTIANTSEVQGNYRPAIVDAVPAIGGLVGTVVHALQGKNQDKPFSGDTAVERYINDSTRRAMLGSERTNKTLGIKDPQTTAELGLRIIGSLAVPQPKGEVIASVVSKLPGGAKTVKAITTAARATPKPISKVAKVVAEVATPLRQTSIAHAAPIAAGLTAGLDYLQNGQVDPTTGKKYESAIYGAPPTPVEDHPPEEPMDDIDKMMLQTAVEVGDAADPVDAAMVDEPQEHEIAAIKQEQDHNRYQEAAVAVLGALGGLATLKYSKRFLQAREAAAVAPENLPQFTGKKFRKSRIKGVDKVIGAVAQQDKPIRSMAEEFLGRDYAKQWGYRADRMSNVSIGARTRHLFQTGEMPSTNAHTIKLAPLAEAYAKELSQEEQLLVSDALNAASSLDDFRATGKLSSLNTDKAGNPVTPAQLELLVQKVRSDPKLAKYYDGIQKSYDDLAKFRVMRGRDTWEGYAALRNRRPNYVAMNRDLDIDASIDPKTQKYSANRDQGFASRSEDEAGGVQGTNGVGNPFISIFDDWTNEVRRSDLNDLRADFLVNMDAANPLNAKGDKIIYEIGSKPNKIDEFTHEVRINGHPRYFRVNDPQVSNSLNMSPRASVKILEAMRQANQSMTTGALSTIFNAFTAIKTPIYDTTMGMLIRPKGVALGIGNELFGTNVPDPTTIISAYTGAARYLWDDMKGGIATHLRNNMIQENSYLKGLLGDANLDHLASVFENSYENSIKADMDRHGITSITMHGSPDASVLTSGVEHVAPNFADAAGNLVSRYISEEQRAGELNAMQAALAQSKSAFGRAKANRIVRAYGNVLEALHNGFRYSAHATNRGRITNLDKHISDMRRLSADSAQHGSNDKVNMALGSFSYANLSVQSLYELARRAKENPGNALFNLSTTVATMAALHYAAIGSDPDAQQKHMLKTPQQKASSLTTFGGNEIPLDPVMRLFTSFLFPIYDHMSGMSDGKYNPDFFQVMENWIDGEGPQASEAADYDQKAELWQSVKDNNPFQASSLPAYNIIAGSLGIDTGMSRMTGEPLPVKEQNLTGTEGDVRRPGSISSAYTENLIASLFSTVGRSLYQIADDMYRAFNAPGQEGSLTNSLDAGLQRWKDTAVKGSGPVKTLLFGDYPSVESAADANYQLMKERDEGIDQALKMYQQDVKTGGLTTTATPRYSEFTPEEPGILPPEVNGTEAGFIAEMTSQMERQFLSKNRQQLSALGENVERYNAQYLSKLPERTLNINQINEERRYQRLMMLNTTRKYEEIISERLGRPFTYKNFNPKDYMRPIGGEPPK